MSPMGMKSVGEILKELGFNKDAPREAHIAFLKHLAKAADQTANIYEIPSIETKREKKRDYKIGEQLDLFGEYPDDSRNLSTRKLTKSGISS